MQSVRLWRQEMSKIRRDTAEYPTDTENTKLSAQLQNAGKLGVYLVFERVKREDTSRNDTQLEVPQNRMKWAFFDDMTRYD